MTDPETIAAQRLAKLREALSRRDALLERARYTLGVHTAHWDATGQSGAGCPVCIEQRELKYEILREIDKLSDRNLALDQPAPESNKCAECARLRDEMERRNKETAESLSLAGKTLEKVWHGRSRSEQRLKDLRPDARVIDLAERLCASGPKAAHVSASECHEITDFILSLAQPSPDTELR